MTIRIKPRARGDLLAVRQWGLDHWGAARARDFLEGMLEAIETLQHNPLKGRSRESLGAGLRSIRYQGYAIFYTVENEAPVIVAVLHERRHHAALNFADRMDGEG